MFQPGYFRVQTVGRYDTVRSPVTNLTQIESQRKGASARTRKQAVEFAAREEGAGRIFNPFAVVEKSLWPLWSAGASNRHSADKVLVQCGSQE
jgi:hypothetical protein